MRAFEAPVVALDAVGSTNVEAVRLHASGQALPFWVTATTQTAGRGRGDRIWISEAGNLYSSFVFVPGCQPQQRSQLSLVVALAVHETVANVLPAGVAVLKWPNDCLVNGGKVAGILLESLQANSDAVIVGCGMNITAKPEALDYPAASLAEFCPSVTVQAVFDGYRSNLDKWVSVWRSGAGFDEIRTEWLARAQCENKRLYVRNGSSRIAGICRGLQEDGALLLEREEGGMTAIYAGDVVAHSGEAGA